MDAFIYFTQKLDIGLDEIEDDLDHALGDFGEVTGVGTREAGSNIDIEIKDDRESEAVLKLIRSVLVKFSVPKSSTVDIDGAEYKVFE